MLQVYERTGSVGAAAAAIGVSESTARRHLRRYYASEMDEQALLNRSRKTPPSVVAAVWTLYYRLPPGQREHRARHIAGVLSARGTPITHPTVSAILAAPPPPGFPPLNRLTLPTDDMIAHLRAGILASERDDVDAARRSLYHEAWQHVGRLTGERGAALLTTMLVPGPRGLWLLKSLVELAHILVTEGDHVYARDYTTVLLRWMAAQDADSGRRRSWAREAERVGQTHLNWDDVWCDLIGVHASAFRSYRRPVAVAALHAAIERLERGVSAGATGRRDADAVRPRHPEGRLGSFYTLLGRLELKLGTSPAALVEQHQEVAAQHLAGVPRLLVVAEMERAYLDSTLALADPAARREHERRLDQTLQRVAGLLSALATDDAVRAMLTIDAAQVYLTHGMEGQIDQARLQQAIQRCVEIGMASHIRKLIRLPGVERVLAPETLAGLRPLARLAHP